MDRIRNFFCFLISQESDYHQYETRFRIFSYGHLSFEDQLGLHESITLSSIYQCEFRWESIIQRRLLSPEWSKCTWVEFSFISDTLDVLALKCGVELVFQHNLEEFTLAQCITSYNGPSTSNERLPFIGRDKFSDSDSHEDQTNGTSSQYSYEGTHTQTAAKVSFLYCLTK